MAADSPDSEPHSPQPQQVIGHPSLPLQELEQGNATSETSSGKQPSPGDEQQEQPSQLPVQDQQEQIASSSTPTDSADADAKPASENPVVELPPIYSVFTTWQKKTIVLLAAVAAFFSPVSAQIYYPALNNLTEDLGVSSSKINLTITTYMIIQAIAPTFIGGFADDAGRRPAYIICFVIYIAANIGLALSKNYASLMVVRCLQSAGSSGTVALCFSVVADIVTSAERGQYVSFTSVPIILAPSLGPVIGGLLSEFLGWRSIFWFLAISSGLVFIGLLFFLPETCRKIVGDGSIPPPVWQQSAMGLITEKKLKKEGVVIDYSKRDELAKKRKLRFPNPFGSVLILLEKEVGLLLAYSAFVYGAFYAMGAAMPTLFKRLYGFNDLQIGLMFLPMAGGSIVAAFTVGKLVNWNYARYCHKLGIPVDKKRQLDLTNFPIERARLEVGLPLVFLCSAAIISWGWAEDRAASIAAPIILMFVVGFALIGFNNAANILIVDIYPSKAGTATAANNLTRCLLGAAFSAFIVPLIDAIGVGWSFTLIGLFLVVFSPALLLMMVNGPKWRKQKLEREAAKKAKKEEKERRRQEMETTISISDDEGIPASHEKEKEPHP